MDLDEPPAKYLPSGTALFPAYRRLPARTSYRTVQDNGEYPAVEGSLGPFTITTPLHSSFDAEWPIPVDVPLAIRGFRHALGLSQAKFATALGQNRLNIERWEKGASRPFRGHVLSLLGLLRPLANDPLAAGQLLNFAAAVVCPHLTRPAATYTGHEIAAPLAEKHLDHRDLAQPLIDALVCSEVLVPLDPPDDLDVRYIPLAGVGALDRKFEPWEAELRAVAQRLDPDDRNMWLAIGKRLGETRDV